MILEIRKQLEALADEKYQAFSSKLIPGVTNHLGVRLPALRKMAKEIAHGSWVEFLAQQEELYFEEIMLQGMVIGYLPIAMEEKLTYAKAFIPKITNWSVCDSFCTGFKFKARDREVVWNFITPYFSSDAPYEIRFGVVMLLTHFVNPKSCNAAFEAFNHISSTDYYVRMGVAWAVATYFTKLPKETLPFLANNQLEDWTQNKAIQKIRESRRVSEELKERVLQLKRK